MKGPGAALAGPRVWGQREGRGTAVNVLNERLEGKRCWGPRDESQPGHSLGRSGNGNGKGNVRGMLRPRSWP